MAYPTWESSLHIPSSTSLLKPSRSVATRWPSCGSERSGVRLATTRSSERRGTVCLRRATPKTCVVWYDIDVVFEILYYNKTGVFFAFFPAPFYIQPSWLKKKKKKEKHT